MPADNTDLASYRATVRQWLDENVPRDWVDRMTGVSEDTFVQFQREWFAKLKSAGLAAPHWPEAWGGENLSISQQAVIYEEIARANAPRPVLYFVSLYHVPSTLLGWGTEEQQRRYLTGVLDGDVWCQGFSEPGAGSDLASLKTRAVKSGDKYVINGQKVWSSLAHYARYCLLLARTDTEAPKHKGISYFVMDMQSPGVTVRPIRQANGASEFCEIFLDDVEIPVENLVGPENAGWKVAQTTLSSERGMTILELSERMRHGFITLVEAARHKSSDEGGTLDPQVSRDLVRIHTDIEALRLMIRQMLQQEEAGTPDSALPLYIKIHYSELLQRFTDLGVRLAGLEGQLWQPGLMGGGQETGNWMFDYVTSWMWTIAGGTNEVLRNVIAERVLGLPR